MQNAVIVPIADLHVGSPFSICPPSWVLPDGSTEFKPNELQRIIRAHWLECWTRVAYLRRDARLIVMVVGDATEGIHHDTRQLITTRPEVQEEMAVSVLEEGLAAAGFNLSKGDKIEFITGTPAHDGLGSSSFERVARKVMDYGGDGRAASDSGDFTVNGVRILVTHRPKTSPGAYQWTKGRSYQSWLQSIYLAELEARHMPPRYVISAHYHHFMPRDAYTSDGHVATTGIMLPGWKLKDEFIQMLDPFSLATIGMCAITVSETGTTNLLDWCIPVEQNRSKIL